MSREICNCENDNFLPSQGSFDLSGRFVNRYAPEYENPRLRIFTGLRNGYINLSTNRANCDTTDCNPSKQQKLAVRYKPTPWRIPYNHYRKRYTCLPNCSTNVKIIKDKGCDKDCQKTTYGIQRLVDKTGVRIRNNGGDYINYLQSMGRTFKQHTNGIIPELRSNDDPNSYKIRNSGSVYNKNFNTIDNSNCAITNQKPVGLFKQGFSTKKVPTAIRKYKNKGFSSNTSVSSKSRLIQLKYNTTLAGQITRNGYNNCINGDICALYQQAGPNTKMRNFQPKCKRFVFKGRKQSCFIRTQPNRTGIVTVTGTTIKDYFLRATLLDSNNYTMSNVTFQWIRDETDIIGAVNQLYKLVEADVGKKIKVRIKYLDGQGYLETVISPPTKEIAAFNFKGSITINGLTNKNQVLTVNIIEQDTPITVNYYQWIRVNPDTNEEITINRSNYYQYSIKHIDVGFKLKVIVNYTDVNNLNETITSPLTNIITFPPQTPGIIQITNPNENIKGRTLTTQISDSNGLSTPYIEYKWIRIISEFSSIELPGENNSYYTLTVYDVGNKIKVQARYIDDDEYVNEIESLETNTIIQPVNIPGQVDITGQTIKEQILTANVEDLNGISGEIIYQWSRKDGNNYTYITAPITGNLNTNNTYTLINDDVGKNIIVNIKYTDNDMYYHDISSNPTNLIVQPANIDGSVSISGIAERDVVLTANVTDENSISGIIYYQWIRVENNTEVNIIGANNQTYTVIQEDVYRKLKVRVQYTDDDNYFHDISSSLTNTIRAVNTLGIIEINGIMKKKQIITANVTDENGITDISYAWIRKLPAGDEIFIGQNSQNYTLVEDDIGNTIKVKAVYTDNNLFFENIISNETSIIENADNISGQLTVSGIPIVGNILSSNIIDGNGLPANISYQWIRVSSGNDENIVNANNSSYTLIDDDVTKTIKLNVQYIDLDNYVENITSVETNIVNSLGSAVISGNTYVGQTLTVTVSDLNNIDSGTDVTYIWIRVVNSTETIVQNILNQNTYVIQETDTSSTIKVRVQYTDDDGFDEDFTTLNSNLINDIGTITISGTETQNQVLSASIQDTNGISSIVTYQWILIDNGVDTNIPNSNNINYTLTRDDVGKTIKVNAQYIDDDGFVENITSIESGIIQQAPNVLGTVVVSGITSVGNELFATVSDDNDLPTTINYQWLRDDVIIPDANNNSYTLVDDDATKIIKVNVQYTDLDNYAQDITSSGTQNINKIGTVTLSGITSPGETLTATVDDINGITGVDISYTWIRINDNNTETIVQDILNQNTYVVQTDDSNLKLKVNSKYKDNHNYDENIFSLDTNIINTIGNVEISGNTVVNRFIEAIVTDFNGIDNSTFTYNWVRVNDTDPNNIIETSIGTNDIKYTIVSDDIGFKLKVSVQYTDDLGYSENISNISLPVNTVGSISVTGDTIVGETLTATILDVDGIVNAVINYQWIRVDSVTSEEINIDGENNSTYIISNLDINNTLKVSATYTDDNGYIENLVSNPTSIVNSVGTVIISGEETTGNTLTATIQDLNGFNNANYQWIRMNDLDLNNIIYEKIGTNNSQYTLVDDDYGKKILVNTLYNDNGGFSEDLSSNTTRYIPKLNINGLQTIGETLTVTFDDIAGILENVNTYDISYNVNSNAYILEKNISDLYPTITLGRGKTYTINLDVTSEHPIRIQSLPNILDDYLYGSGLTHSDGTTGIQAATDKTDGFWTWTIPLDAPDILYYRCANHTNMVGGFNIVDSLINYQWDRYNSNNTLVNSNISQVNSYTITNNDGGFKLNVSIRYIDISNNFLKVINSALTNEISIVGTIIITGITNPGETLNAIITDNNSLPSTNLTQDVSYNSTDNTYIWNNILDSAYPTITLERGKTYTITINVSAAHPIRIQTDDILNGTLYGDGLSHSDGTTDIFAATDKINGTWTWTVPYDAPNTLYYRCANHTNMVGTINIVQYFTYQWIRVDGANEINIGTNTHYYTIVNDDIGKTIKVNAQYTDSIGDAENITSNPTNIINTPPSIIINGTLHVDEILTAVVTDDNGFTDISYKWIRVYQGTETIVQEGVNLNTYTLVSDDAAKTIKVNAQYTDNNNFNENITSNETTEINGNGIATITGILALGQTLTANVSDPNGINGAITYQWIRINDNNSTTNIGINNPNYTLVNDDFQKHIKVNVLYTDNLGKNENITSIQTNYITDTVVFDNIVNYNNESYRFLDYPVNYQDNVQLTIQQDITYIFKINTPGHPFYIKTERFIGDEYLYNDGVTGQGTEVGTVSFRVSTGGDVPSVLYYVSGNTTYDYRGVPLMSGIIQIP